MIVPSFPEIKTSQEEDSKFKMESKFKASPDAPSSPEIMIIPNTSEARVPSPMNLKRASLPATSLDSVEVASFLASKSESSANLTQPKNLRWWSKFLSGVKNAGTAPTFAAVQSPNPMPPVSQVRSPGIETLDRSRSPVVSSPMTIREYIKKKKKIFLMHWSKLSFRNDNG